MANFCGTCGKLLVVNGVVSMPCKCEEERERMSTVEELIEQFDFAIDAVVEVRNYTRNIDGYLSEMPLQYLTEIDRARVHLASARLSEELEKAFGNDPEAAPEEAQQVRGNSNGGGRYSVPFEAGGGEVSRAKCPFGPWDYHESGPTSQFSRSLARHAKVKE